MSKKTIKCDTVSIVALDELSNYPTTPRSAIIAMEVKALARPALAIIWSIIWAAMWFSSGSVPAFVTGITATCVGWFFGSREKEKASIRKPADSY